MITFSIPCWLLWFVTGNLTMLIGLFTFALIAGNRKKKAAGQETDPNQ